MIRREHWYRYSFSSSGDFRIEMAMKNLRFGTKWHDHPQISQEVVGEGAASVAADTLAYWRC